MTACASLPPRGVPRLQELTLDEKIGQLFGVGIYGVFMNETSPAWMRLQKLVTEQHIGGVMLYPSNVYESAHVIRRLQSTARVPLLVSADLEAGMGMRLLDTTYWPWAMAVAATGDPSLAEREGALVARQAKAIGVNHIYAPVCDVNVDPDNPVINARSFGEDPQEVAKYVTAFIRGVHSEGLLTTAKHFPGHGDTHTDSHRSLPVLDVDRARLEKVELIPFRAAIAAGVDSVMIGHLAVPALDPTPVPHLAEKDRHNQYARDHNEAPEAGTLPASLSKTMIDGLLRHDLGFQKVVVTDAMDMGGITDHFTPAEGAVRAIEAGEDQILVSQDTPAAIAGVKAAVVSGRLTEARIDESVRRILEAKSRVPLMPASDDEIFRVVDSEESRTMAGEIARRCITLVREEAGALPIAKDARVVIVSVSEFPEGASPLADFEREMRLRLKTPPKTFLVESRATAADVAPIVEAAKNANVVVFALAVRMSSGGGKIGVPEVARAAFDAIGQLPVRRIGISFGSPYLLRELPSLQTYLCAYGIQPVVQLAATRAVMGEAPVSGRLPVSIPGMYARGFGIDKH